MTDSTEETKQTFRVTLEVYGKDDDWMADAECGRFAEIRSGVSALNAARDALCAVATHWTRPWERAAQSPPEPAFKQFTEEQHQQPSPQEHAEIDQRAAPSAIIAEDAAEYAKEQHDKRMRGHAFVEGPDLLASVIKYLDYQRAQLTIRQPEGDSGDISWLINKALANAGVSPEKALLSAVQKLAEFQVDLYAQNAKIRKRLTELEAYKHYSDEFHAAMLDCFEHRNHDGYEYPPILEAIFQKTREAEREPGNGEGEGQ